MPHSLRPATTADCDWLWSVKRAGMKGYVEQTWGQWNEAEQRARFTANFAAQELQIIVMAGRDAGYTAIKRSPEEIQLFNIMIAPEFQNRGLGTEVLHALLAEARQKKLPLRLQVLKVNPARRLYERIGFALVGETPTHYQMRWTP